MSGSNERARMTGAQAKSAAKNVKNRLNELGVAIGTAQSYEAVAAVEGFANWSTMKAVLERSAETGPSQNAEASANLEVCGEFSEIVARVGKAVLAAADNRKHVFLSSDLWHAFNQASALEIAAITNGADACRLFPAFWKDRSTSFETHAKRALSKSLSGTYADIFLKEFDGGLAETLWSAGKRLSSGEGLFDLEEIGRHPHIVYEDDDFDFLWSEELHFDAFNRIARALTSNFRAGVPEVADTMSLHHKTSTIYELVRHAPATAFETFLRERADHGVGLWRT